MTDASVNRVQAFEAWKQGVKDETAQQAQRMCDSVCEKCGWPVEAYVHLYGPCNAIPNRAANDVEASGTWANPETGRDVRIDEALHVPDATRNRAANDVFRLRQAIRFLIADRIGKGLGVELSGSDLEILTDNFLQVILQYDEDVK